MPPAMPKLGNAWPDAATQMNSSLRPSLLVWAATIFAIAVVVFVLGFYRENEAIDELGLFNPIYMFLHTGRMTYPIYGVTCSPTCPRS